MIPTFNFNIKIWTVRLSNGRITDCVEALAKELHAEGAEVIDVCPGVEIIYRGKSYFIKLCHVTKASLEP